eukprot:9987427-Karenia_brevis.AAC.1
MTSLRTTGRIFMVTVAHCRVGLVSPVAQVWPTRMCRRLDSAIRSVISHRSSITSAFPTTIASIGCA